MFIPVLVNRASVFISYEHVFIYFLAAMLCSQASLREQKQEFYNDLGTF